VAGLRGIDPAVRRAALGLGMTRWQRLRWVEAPLAAPVAMAGIRTATVWTVGAATLSTTVGYSSLGNPIFAGLQLENWTLVLAGCVGAAGLALAADGLLACIERGVAARRTALVALGLGGLALGGLLSLAPLHARPERTVVIGAKNFSEQYILARLVGDRLARAGYRVGYREGLGSAVAFQALRSGAIDAYVDYAGTLWTGAMRRTDPPPPALLPAIARWMAAGPRTGIAARLGFENAYAIAVRPDTGMRTLNDLAQRAPSLTLGADLEFLDRPEWRAVRDAYRLRFAATRAYAPTFMYRALASGQAGAISAFSSDGRIAADHLTVLTDPARALPRYDALLLVSPARARDGRFLDVLKGLDGAVPIAAMRAANYQVDRDADKRTPEQAARWLAGQLG